MTLAMNKVADFGNFNVERNDYSQAMSISG